MFVHPATHHVGRTYHGNINPNIYPTTGKKNLNKENAGALPSKTPSRTTMKGMVPSTSIRMGLGVKSAMRDGNVMHRGYEGKGKGKEEEIEPKRLFTSTTAGSSKNGLAPSKSLSSLQTIIQPSKSSKTPGPARHHNTLRTPAPVQQIPPTPLPSASRTRRRSRQSLTPIKPVEFKTPAPSGNAKWEEEISLGSIGEAGFVDLDNVEEVEEEVEDNELEYMPPKMPEIPWEPPFEVPDLQKVFTVLADLPPLWTPHEDPVITMPELDLKLEKEQPITLCDDDELEEPIFRRKAPAQEVEAKPLAAKVRIAVPPTRGNSASNTNIARRPLTSAVSRPGSTLTRITTATTRTAVTKSAPTKPAVPAARAPISRPGLTRSTIPPRQPISSSRAPIRAAPVPVKPIIKIDDGSVDIGEIPMEDFKFSLDFE